MTKVALAVSVAVLAACSRSAEAPPKATREKRTDAVRAPDASAAAKAPPATPATPFTIVARAPSGVVSDRLGGAMPLVQRLAGGGLVVAAEYARAVADGPGPLSVEIVRRGLEAHILNRPSFVQGSQSIRWVWSDPSTSIFVDEEEKERSGPRLASFKSGSHGFEAVRGSVGYWSAVARDGSVLALERTAYEVPNSSMYPKGSGYEQNAWGLKPARVAVLSGKGPAPILPPGVCPTSMSAAPDGTVVVAVEKCQGGESAPVVGVLRYAPAAAQAKVEWFAERTSRPANSGESEAIVSAASANEIYVAEGERLETWNGKEWTSTTPFPNDRFVSISRAPGGELWAVLSGHDDRTRVEKRSADGVTWTSVALPTAPPDPLDPQPYTAPTWEVQAFVRVDVLPEEQALRGSVAAPLLARKVDAAGDEVLVLATAQGEAFVVSTRSRSPVARLPSLAVQRAQVLQTLKPRFATSPKDCHESFLIFPQGTTLAALRRGLPDAGSPQKVGEAIVEGQKRLVVYGDHEAPTAAAKRLATLAPKRVCGPPVVERTL